MALIKLMFAFLIFCVSCGAVGSFFVFLIDVIRWHRAEKRVVVSASAQKLPNMFEEVNDNVRESSRSDYGNRGDNSDSSSADSDNGGQSSASALFDSWLQP